MRSKIHPAVRFQLELLVIVSDYRIFIANFESRGPGHAFVCPEEAIAIKT